MSLTYLIVSKTFTDGVLKIPDDVFVVPEAVIDLPDGVFNILNGVPDVPDSIFDVHMLSLMFIKVNIQHLPFFYTLKFP